MAELYERDRIPMCLKTCAKHKESFYIFGSHLSESFANYSVNLNCPLILTTNYKNISLCLTIDLQSESYVTESQMHSLITSHFNPFF